MNLNDEFKTKVSVDLDTTKAEKKLKELGNKKIAVELDTSKMSQQLKELDDKTVKVDVDTGNAKKNIDDVDKSIKNAHKSTKSFGDTLKRSLNIGTAATIIAKGFRLISEAAKDAVKTVKDFDDSIRDLRMATGENYKSVQQLVKGYNATGKAIGATTTEITEAADSWLRQGHSIADTNTLIRDSMILSKVAQLDSADSTGYLTSAMKGYKVAVDDVIGIVDKLTAVDLVSATDAGGLAEAMSRTAVTADMAGISMDRLLGYLAVTGEVTQKSMSTIGESYKTILTRMSDIKADKLELVDEDGTTELLSDVELTLKNVGIDLRATINEYNNYGEVLDNLAAKWNSLSQVQQNALAKAFAGVRQAENFRVLMENYDTAIQYMHVAADSAGNAEKKFGAYLDSIEAKTKSLQAAFESLAVDSFSTEMYGGIVDATTALVEFLDKSNLVKGAITGIAVASAIKGFTTLATGISHAAIRLNEFNSALKLVKAGNIGENEIEQLAKMTANLSKSQLKAVLSSKSLSTEQRIAILTTNGMSDAEAKAALSSMGLATAEGAATTSTFSLTGALKGLWSTLLANPLVLVATAITAVVSVASTLRQKAEEAKQAAIEAGEAAKQEANEIIDLYNAYQKANVAYKSNAESKSDLENATDSLLEKLGYERTRIQELIKEYGSLDDAIKAITLGELRDAERDLRGSYEMRKDELIGELSPDVFTGVHKVDLYAPKRGYNDENRDAYKALIALAEAELIDIDNLHDTYTQTLINDDAERTKFTTEILFRLGNRANEDLSTAEGVINAYNRLGEMLDVVNNTIGSDNYVYKGIYEQYNKLSDLVSNYKDSFSSVNDNLAEQFAIESLVGKEIPAAKEEFDEYRNSLIETAIASKKFIGSQEDIEAAIDGFLSSEAQFAQFYDDYTSLVTTAEEKTAEVKEAFESSKGDVVDIISSLSNAIDLLKTALDEMSNGGSLSLETIETLKKLVGEEENYLDYLTVENGLIKLNAEAWRERNLSMFSGDITSIENEIQAIQDSTDALIAEREFYLNSASKFGEISEETEHNIYYTTPEGELINTLDRIDEINREIETNNEKLEESQDRLSILKNLIGQVSNEAFDAFGKLDEEYENLKKSVSSLVDAYKSLNDGESLSKKNIVELLAKYPELIEYYDLENDALNIQMSTIEALFELQKQQAAARIRQLKEEYDATFDLVAANKTLGELYAQISTMTLTLDVMRYQGQNVESSGIWATYQEYKEQYDKIQQDVEAYYNRLNNLESSATIIENMTLSDFMSSSSSSGSSGKSSSSDKPKVFDWIEVAIDRISEAFDRLKDVATNSFKSLKTRLSATHKEITAINKEILLQQKAYERYMQQANSVGLSADLKQKVQDGSIQISEYNGETAELIESYETWYNKAIKCQNAISDLHKELASLYKDNFNNIQADYENQLEMLEHSANTRRNNLSDYKVTNYQDYTALQSIQSQNISVLQKELADLQRAFNEAMDSGEIEEYSESWFDMRMAINKVEEAIQSAHEELASLYEEVFDNIQSNYNNQLSLLAHLTRSYNTGIDQLEAMGYLASTKFYAALQDVEKQNIATMEKELADLQKALSDALDSGEIEKYSDSWYEFQESINSVEEAIAEANVNLLEFAKTMREIEWDHFDYLQNRISQVTQEANFLINLLSHKNLYQDNGQLSDEGLATVGLHAQNYNVYMAQADQYAEEILAINKELANDPYNTDLIARREELLRLQQESILAAENEKDAIIDMVREGIEYELNSLKELISLYTDALDHAKNYYEYQRRIADQTENIASLEKQLSAYEGRDDSEEARATIQKIKVKLEDAKEDLAETEYDQFVTETKKLLDNLYDEYESLLNERLDDVDTLLSEMIDSVNANSDSIANTIMQSSSEVGYMLTDEMRDIWLNNLQSVVSMYGDDFSSQLTTVNQVISGIQASVNEMIAVSNNTANSIISAINSAAASISASNAASSRSDTTVSNPVPTTPTPTTPTTPTTPSTPSPAPSTSKEITIGGKINAGSAKIYSYVGDTAGVKQYFSDDPIYTVLDEQSGYLKVRWHKATSGVTGWFKKSDVKAYKTGGLVDYTGLAQLDGTPGKPELVLNAQDTDNFLELRDALRAISQRELTFASQSMDADMYGIDISPQFRGITDIYHKLNEISTSTFERSPTATFGDIVIDIDHVENYEDLVEKMKIDGKFERMIKAMTIDQIAGRSSLAKNKFSWK